MNKLDFPVLYFYCKLIPPTLHLYRKDKVYKSIISLNQIESTKESALIKHQNSCLKLKKSKIELNII